MTCIELEYWTEYGMKKEFHQYEAKKDLSKHTKRVSISVPCYTQNLKVLSEFSSQVGIEFSEEIHNIVKGT